MGTPENDSWCHSSNLNPRKFYPPQQPKSSMDLGQVGVTMFQGFGWSCSAEAAPVYRDDYIAVVHTCNVCVIDALTMWDCSASLCPSCSFPANEAGPFSSSLWASDYHTF